MPETAASSDFCVLFLQGAPAFVLPSGRELYGVSHSEARMGKLSTPISHVQRHPLSDKIRGLLRREFGSSRGTVAIAPRFWEPDVNQPVHPYERVLPRSSPKSSES